MTHQPPILKVALPVPLRRAFDYLPPAGTHAADVQVWQPGLRLQVPFGSQSLCGLLLGVSDKSELRLDQLKAAERVLDREPVLGSELLALCQWAAGYYHCPIGEALHAALPALLRQGADPESVAEPYWRLTTAGKGLPAGALKNARKQSALHSALLERGQLNRQELSQLDIGLETAKQLQAKGLAETTVEPAAPQSPTTPILAQAPLPLNAEQEVALSQLRFHSFNTFLLEGATGSGKTEVYLQALSQMLEQGRQALVLVPEIGLTPQLVGRFQQRFNQPIATLHSGMTDRERLQAWREAALGRAAIVIGTRSAIFTPLPTLGMIIIDEEHDTSFKQQDGFRYSARDLAAVRAQRLNIPLLMGSATPALETLYNATGQRYQHLRLTRRAGGARAPGVDLIDLRGKIRSEGFTEELFTAIETELDAGNQALVFINRRGYAPVLICHDCGWIAGCPHCSARLTVHQLPPHLHCHHCDHQRPIARACPDCLSPQLQYLGLGTERSEAALQQRFPDTPVIRVDRDTTRRRRSLEAIIDQVHQGKPCILVGTQMLAKGHHFPDVTLVALLNIDGGLFSGDFRGPERMGQLLVQVAGRAGRADKPGKVLIQSHHCDHPNIQSLIKEGYHRYARRLLQERKLAGLPPYRYLALFRAESKRPENAVEFLQAARQFGQQLVPPGPKLSYLGPLPALMERKKDRYCFQLQINGEQRQTLHKVVGEICRQMENHALSRRARWSVDIDPQDMS